MKYPLFLLCFLLCLSAKGQDQNEEDVTISAQEISTGTNLRNHTDLIGIRYKLSYDIYNSYIDSDRNELFMVLRKPKKKYYYGKGYYEAGAHIALFDLKTGKIKWTKDLRSNVFYVTDTKVIETIGGECSICFNKADGKKLWKSEERIYYANKDIGIGFNDQKTLNGIDLNTGRKIWERKLKGNDPDLDHVIPINDTVILAVSQGLQTINLHTGQGWSHKLAISDSRMQSGNLLTSALVGGITGAIFGIAVVPSAQTTVVSNHSQVLVSDNKIYFATKRTLLCYNLNGDEIWTQALPEDSTSESHLFIYKDNIVLVNRGYVNMNGVKLKHGLGFWASFNKENGKKNIDFTGIEDAGFEDYSLNGDTLLVLAEKGRIYKYLLGNGQQIFSKKIDLKKKAYKKFITGRGCYTAQPESAFTSIYKQYPGNYFIASSDTGIICYSPSFDKSSIIPTDQLWSNVSNYKGYILLNREALNSVLIKNDQQEAALEVTEDAIIINNILYNIGRNNFTVTDLSNIIH